MKNISPLNLLDSFLQFPSSFFTSINLNYFCRFEETRCDKTEEGRGRQSPKEKTLDVPCCEWCLHCAGTDKGPNRS